MPSSNPLEDLVASMSVRELAQHAGVSVASIVAHALRGPSSPKKTPGPAAKAPTNDAAAAAKKTVGRARAGRVDTRSASGREAYEAAVLGVVRDAPGEVAANDIRAAVGGTPLQARAALNRLIEKGDVKFKGKARGTRYFT